MQDWIHEIDRDPNSFVVELNKKESLDIEIFQRMANDEFCLPSLLKDKEKGRILYSIQDKVSLDDFLNQYVFEKEEGYAFLIHLFESAIAVNRNKPVYFQPQYIFLDSYAQNFYFTVIPLSIQEWMFQNDQTKEWIEYLTRNFKTNTAFEIPGYLIRFLSTNEFSLSNLILGLKNIQNIYYPKRFFKRKKTIPFRVQEPIRPLNSYKIKEEKVVEDNKTQILGWNEPLASLQINQEWFQLQNEITWIGRGYGCDIQLKEEAISMQHARIICENDRFYIMDCKSLNGTYLEGKKVQRKMRLKDGMHLQFANIEAIFHQ
ncbi:FHA domain-containing protein [Floccifex sp.]|uniref:FHA domain-containing protein n=1 Tax=Floccifex sp. TaxID=2815810 RepID=UPI003F0071DD